MKKTSENKRKKVIFIGIAAAVLLLAALIAYLVYRYLHPRKIILPDSRAKLVCPVEHIGRAPYYDSYVDSEAKAFSVYMFDEYVNGVTFSERVGIDFYKPDHCFKSFRMMHDYILSSTEQFPEDDFPRYYLLGIDPYATYLQSCSNRNYFEKNLEFLYRLSEDHPETAFLIYFPSDSPMDWTSLTDEQRSEARLSYIAFVRYFKERPNVMMYYVSAREWVLYSQCIRADGFESSIRGDIYDHLISMNLTESDLISMLTWSNVNDEMDRIIQMSEDYEQVRETYADLSGKDVFFIGDSVIGNYRDSTSIPSFFKDMTGADVYNLAVGGWAGVSVANPSSAMGCAFAYLMGNKSKDEFVNSFSYCYSYPAYSWAAEALRESDDQGENAIFVIEFGLNDYFCGLPQSEFRDALVYFAESIKKSYPKARIVFLAPGYVNTFEFGYQDTGADGNHCFLQDYRDITCEVAAEQGCEYISLTDDFGFTQEDAPFYLLQDNIHYNDNGRYLLAQGLARYFNK